MVGSQRFNKVLSVGEGVYGGEIGIRTLGTLLRYAGFQDQPRDKRNGDFHAVKKDFAGFSKGRAFNREWQGHSDSIRY